MSLLSIGAIYNSADTDPIFVRFQAACLIAAKDVKAEAENTPNHESRLAWANGMLSSDLTSVRSRTRAHLRLAIAGNAAFQSAGPDIIDGLVSAITGGQSDVVKAMTDLAGGAIDAAKDVLGIKSPSKVFAEIGGYTAEGFAQGVDDGAGAASSALDNLTDAPDAKGGAKAAGGAHGPIR
jgi:hypothetical protein